MILPCFIVLVLFCWDKLRMFAVVFLTCQFLSTVLTVLISFCFVFFYQCNISYSVPSADSNLLCVASNIIVLSVMVLSFNSTSCLSSASSCFISFCYLPVCPWRWSIPSYTPALNSSSMVANAYHISFLMWHVWSQSSCLCYKLFLVTTLHLSSAPVFLFLFFLAVSLYRSCASSFPAVSHFWMWQVLTKISYLQEVYVGERPGSPVRPAKIFLVIQRRLQEWAL